MKFTCNCFHHPPHSYTQAFECFLASVKPNYSNSCPEGCWSTDAILFFRDLTLDKYLIADVRHNSRAHKNERLE